MAGPCPMPRATSFHPVAGNEAAATPENPNAELQVLWFPSRCRERGGCNAQEHKPTQHWQRVSIPLPGTRRLQRCQGRSSSNIRHGFPSRCRERGGCNQWAAGSLWLQRVGFHPVAGNEAVATSCCKRGRVGRGARFPSRCRERGGCNTGLPQPRCYSLASFHPVAGNEAVATCRPPATIHAFSQGFHPVAGNEAVATWQNEATQAAL